MRHYTRIVEVNHSTSDYGGYEISPGQGFENAKIQTDNFLAKNNEKIAELFGNFGDFSAKELELRATIVYCDRDCRTLGKESSFKDFVSIVHDIKPGFEIYQIEAAIRELERLTYLPSRV